MPLTKWGNSIDRTNAEHLHADEDVGFIWSNESLDENIPLPALKTTPSNNKKKLKKILELIIQHLRTLRTVVNCCPEKWNFDVRIPRRSYV